MYGVGANQELLGFDAHSAELADDLQELSLVLGVVLQLGKQVEQGEDVVTKDRLSGVLNALVNVIPVEVELVLLVFVDLEHGAGDNTDVHTSHQLLTIVHHDLFEHLWVDEFIDEPAGTSDIFINICLDVARHVG